MFLSVVVSAGNGFTQNASSAGQEASAESLTHSLVALNVQFQSAGSADKSKLLNKLLAVAAERQQLLLTLIEDDPGEVLRVAIPADIRADLPFAVQAYVEEEAEIEGELEVLHVDYEDQSQSHYLYFLKAAGERLSLHFAAKPPTDLLTGSKIRVKGVQIDGAMALESGGTSSVQTLSAAALPNTFGEQKTIVILVNFQDNPTQPYTPAFVQNLVFGTVSNFYQENSFGQTWLSGSVYGWYTIPVLSTTCDTPSIRSEANKAATAAGADLSQYNRFVYMFPATSACTWAGLAWVGGSPSQAFINGVFSLRVVGHELGHNLGLLHAHALDCDISPLGNNCNILDTGDRADIMGGRAGHFNAYHKELLGWLNNGAMPPITTVETSGSYTLDPYESNNLNPKALKILKSVEPTTGAKTWYYLEYRQPLGFDSILNGVGNLVSGVLIHTGSEDSGVGSYELDMTPNSVTTSGFADLEDGALVVGQSFSDPDAGVTITTQWANSSNAGVSVSLSQPSCVHANPSLTLSPSQSQWVKAGTAMTYSVSVTNNDDTGCSASSFNLQSSVPSGWTATFAAPTLTISPGTSASTTLTITSPAAATDGFYTIGVTATTTTGTYTTYTASTSATYVIVSGLRITVSTDKSSYIRNQTVIIKAVVSAGGSPVANASVTFVITKSNGAVVTQTATTDSSGSAVFNLRLRQKDPVGIYQVRVDAKNNTLSGSATTSFTVQ